MSRLINIKPDFQTTNNFTMDYLIMRFDEIKPEFKWANRFVCGLPVPNFQRQLKWNVEKMIAFIESCWNGYDIGSYMIVKNEYGNQFVGAVIDGQQRLSAIESYLNDEFKVFGYKWSELTMLDQRAFENIPFPCRQLHVWDEQKLRDTYNRLNFSGVVHTLEEQA